MSRKKKSGGETSGARKGRKAAAPVAPLKQAVASLSAPTAEPKAAPAAARATPPATPAAAQARRQPTDAEIAARAHQIWVEGGSRKPGTPLEDWLRAERELRART